MVGWVVGMCGGSLAASMTAGIGAITIAEIHRWATSPAIRLCSDLYIKENKSTHTRGLLEWTAQKRLAE